MCRRAYVKRIAGTVYPDVRYFIEQLTKNIVAHSIINMDSHKRKTLKLQDVKSGLETAAGIQLYGVD